MLLTGLNNNNIKPHPNAFVQSSLHHILFAEKESFSSHLTAALCLPPPPIDTPTTERQSFCTKDLQQNLNFLQMFTTKLFKGLHSPYYDYVKTI